MPLGLHTISSCPENTPPSPGIDSQLEHVGRTTLQNAVLQGIIAKKDRLYTMGAISTDDDSELQRQIAEAFEAFWNRDPAAPDAQKRWLYSNVAHWIVLSGIARANILADWSIDRATDEAGYLGLQSYPAMEVLLAEKYGTPGGRMYHLHEGSGDNSVVYHLGKNDNATVVIGDNSIAQRNDCVRQLGMGDTLYFSIEKLLRHFICPERAQDPVALQVVRVLTEAVQRRLQERWLTKEEGRHAHDENPLRDLNTIFELLAHPKELLKGIHLAEKARLILSREFIADTEMGVLQLHEREEVSFMTHAWLMKFAGTADESARQEFRTHELSLLRRRESRLRALARLVRKYDSGERHKGRENPEALPEHIKMCGQLMHIPDVDAVATTEALAAQIRQKLEMTVLRRLELELEEKMSGKTLTRYRDTYRQLCGDNIPDDLSVNELQARVHTRLNQTADPDELPMAPPGRVTDERTREATTKIFTADFIAGIDHWETYATADYADYRKSERYAANDFHRIDPATVQPGEPYVIRNVPNDAHIRIDGGNAFRVTKTSASPRKGFTVQQTAEGEIRFDLDEGCGGFTVEVVSMLDLNRHPDMYLKNFVPGKFEDIAEIFPHGSCMLLSAVRSHSHLSDDDFFRILEDNVALLQPGACLITDGITQSYTRILRLAESTHPDLRAEVLLDSETHKPMALLLQRKHKKGFLSDEEKRKVFRGGVYWKPPENVARLRPDLQISTTVRRSVATLFGKSNNARVAQVHRALDENLARQLVRVAAWRYVQEHGRHVVDDAFLPEVQQLLARYAQAANEPAKSTIGTIEAMASLKPKTANLQFYDMCEMLMETCGAASNDPNVRTLYERAVFYAIAARLYAKEWELGPLYREQGTEEGVEVARLSRQQSERVKEPLMGKGRNLDYSASPLLRARDIRAIQTRVIADLRGVMAEQGGETGTLVADGTRLEFLSGRNIHTFPRLTGTHASINRHRELPGNSLPKNEAFFGGEAAARMERKQETLRQRLRHLQRCMGVPPIVIVRFTDCVTNILLLQKMQEMLGLSSDTFVQVLRVDFRDEKTDPIAHLQIVQKQIEERIKNGGIVLGGGSWWDTYDPQGKCFKQQILRQLLANIQEPNSNLRFVGICYSHQAMGDLVGAGHGIRTQPGALEIGPTPIRVSGKGKNNPLFLGCPDRMTVAMTHSGHLHGSTFNRNNADMCPLAWSHLTSNPVAWTALANRILCMQFHPEIDLIDDQTTGIKGGKLSPDVRTVMEQMKGMAAGLQGAFGIGIPDIRHNWDQATKSVTANAGREILVNALLHHANELSTKIQ